MSSRPLPKLKPALWDALIYAAVALLAAAVLAATFGGRSGDLTVEVSLGGEVVAQCPLAALQDPMTFTNNGVTLTVSPREEGVCVSSSDCPTQDCVHTGTIRRAGQSIVCLPGRMVVHLSGTPAADAPDVIVG